MGVVYEAEHAALGRRVALKVLPDRLSGSAEAVERFRREARAIARLHHSNIVPVFEVGDDQGRLFLAMQLISGRSLDEVIGELRQHIDDSGGAISDLLTASAGGATSSSSLSIRPAGSSSSSGRSSHSDQSGSHRDRHFHAIARIGLQTADALHYAHERGVIHRDVKPSNLLLDKNGVVWLTDFGLAKTDDDDLTRTGDFVGTLKYMAPERFNGLCDVRSDVYSVGLTLYELIALRPAFDAADRLKLMEQIVKSDPVHLRTLVRGIPRDLETIVMKAIDHEPKSRYRSAKDLADDLDCYLHDQPIKARRHTIPEKLVRWSRRNRSLAASLAVTTVMALLTIVVLAVSLRTSRQATAEARAFASRSLLTQADLAFDNQQFQSASLLAAASLTISPSDAAKAKLQLARASAPAHLRWTSPTLSNVNAISRSADGRFIAAASGSGDEIHIFHADSLKLARRIDAHDQTVTSVAFSPDGDRLLSGSQDQAVRLWDTNSGELRWSHSIRSASSSIAIDPTGRFAVAGGVFRGTVSVWDCRTGRTRHQFIGDGSPVRCVAFDGEGSKLAAGFENGDVHVWDLATTRLRVFSSDSVVNALVFSQDGGLAIGATDGVTVWKIDSDSHKPIDVNDEKVTREVTALAIAPDKSELAAAYKNGEIRYFDTKTHIEKVDDRLNVVNPISHLLYAADGSRLIVGTENEGARSADRSIRLIDRATGDATAWTEGHVGRMTQIAFSADSTRMVSLADDRTLRIWDATQGDVIHRLSGHGVATRCVAFDPRGAFVAAGAVDKTIRVWDAVTGDEFGATARVGASVLNVAFDASGDRLASSTGRAIQFWRVDRKRRALIRDTEAIVLDGTNDLFIERTLRFSENGDLMACGTLRGRVMIWSASTGDLIAEFYPDENRRVLDVQFSKDGKTLAVFSHEYRLGVFDISDPASPVETTHFVNSSLASMSLSPDGKMIVTGCYNQDVSLWSVTTGQRLGEFEGHRGRVMTIEFGPSGNCIASGSNAEIRMWDLQTSDIDTIRGAEVVKEGYTWRDFKDMLFAFEFSSDENLMFLRGLWGGSYNAVLLNRQTREKRHFVGAHGGDIDPDDQWLAISTKAGDFDMYSLKGNEKFPLEHDGTPMKSVLFNADGTLLAGIGPTNISVWDPATKKRLYSFPAHQRGIRNRLAFHPTDPNLLASGGDDSMHYLWRVDASGHKRLRQFEGHGGMVGLLAFTSDGKRLATCARAKRRPHCFGMSKTVHSCKGSWDTRCGSTRSILAPMGAPSPRHQAIRRCGSGMPKMGPSYVDSKIILVTFIA